MQAVLHELVTHLQQGKMDPAAALLDIRRADHQSSLSQLAYMPIRDIGWRRLSALGRRDPRRFKESWMAIKHDARNHIRSGHFAARGAGVANQHPWECATRF